MRLKNWIQLFVASALFIGAGSTSVYSENTDVAYKATIAAIEAGELADLIALDAGLTQGFEEGMLLTAVRDNRIVGELLVTRSTEHCSVALIVELNNNEILAVGDTVSPKLRTL